jgi:YbbR domain-containing protein
MISDLLHRLWDNIGSLLLSLALAFAVWVSAVIAEDPNQECAFPTSVALEVVGKDPDLIVVGTLVEQVSVTLRAPSTVCDQLASEPEAVNAVIDLSGLETGEHVVPVDLEFAVRPVRAEQLSPTEVEVALETQAVRELFIRSVVTGEPALGFQADARSLSERAVEVSGPQSLVEQVEEVLAEIDISGARETVMEEVVLRAVDQDGQTIEGLTLSPASVVVTQTITQSGGYRDVAVKVEVIGQPASGYRLTNISVSPLTVTIFSTDPELVDQLPGYVQTEPLDLTDIKDDVEVRLPLDLPEGISAVDEQSVLVVVGITAIESSIPATIEVEVKGLGPGLAAQVSPESVDVILLGPLPVLDALEEGDVRFFVDLTGLDVGTHLVVPEAEILPDRVTAESINPETIEVTITQSNGPTATATQSSQASPTPTP